MAPALQGVMGRFWRLVGCSLVSGLLARSWAADVMAGVLTYELKEHILYFDAITGTRQTTMRGRRPKDLSPT